MFTSSFEILHLTFRVLRLRHLLTASAFATMLSFILALLCAAVANALPTIEAKGAKFFTSDGDQWYIKGELRIPPDAFSKSDILQALHTNSLKMTRLPKAINANLTPA